MAAEHGVRRIGDRPFDMDHCRRRASRLRRLARRSAWRSLLGWGQRRVRGWADLVEAGGEAAMPAASTLAPDPGGGHWAGSPR